MTNSADPDQLASTEANWSGSTLFVKNGVYPGSAELGLKQSKKKKKKKKKIWLTTSGKQYRSEWDVCKVL